MKSFRLLLMAAVASFVMVSCASVAHVEKDETVNFSKYRTFAWVETSATKEESKRISDLTERNIMAAVNAELHKSGWRESKNKPDVLLSYDVLVEKNTKQQNNPVYSEPYTRWFFNPYTRRWASIYYPSQFMGYDNRAYQVSEGTLTVTMLDAKTEKTVWQGWTTDELRSRNLSNKEIQSSVKNIFRKFDVAKK